jgi:hypothetical protein
MVMAMALGLSGIALFCELTNSLVHGQIIYALLAVKDQTFA